MAKPTPPPQTLATRQKISLSKTKYTKDYLAKGGAEYIEKFLNMKDDEKRMPTVAGFCLHVGISRSRLYELAGIMDEVADIVEYIGLMQEDLALNGGMFNKTNPIFSMFLLKSKHNYRDTPANLTQNNTFNVSPELLADALTLMRKNSRTPVEAAIEG